MRTQAPSKPSMHACGSWPSSHSPQRCECPCAGGLPADAPPCLLVCGHAVAHLLREAAVSKPTGKSGVKLGEKGAPGVLTACGGAATTAQRAACTYGFSFHLKHRGFAPVSSKQGGQKSSPGLTFWGNSVLVLEKQKRNRDA